jgi:lipopolysaccharide/colanic/teichoic acid biosynthesis glycosyltransferase
MNYQVWFGSSLPILQAVLPIWVLLSFWLRLDGFRGGWRFTAVVSQLFLAVCCTLSLLLVGAYLTQPRVSRLGFAYFGLLLFWGFVAIRYVIYALLRALYKAGLFKRAVILGTGRMARELATKIGRHPELLCKVVGFLQLENTAIEPPLQNQKADAVVSVSSMGVLDLLRSHNVDELILATSLPTFPEVLNLIGRCREIGIRVGLVPEPYELYLSRLNLLDLDGLPVLHFQQPSTSALFVAYKRIVDVSLSVLFMLATSPVVLPAALYLRRKTGHAFRKEIRCGLHGRIFAMVRLNVDRPLRSNSRAERILDQLSCTELPQLWNVLCGEMSLVGPRPESPERVRRYSDWHRQRLTVKPGITGLAQVHGVRELNSSEEKARFDLQYLLNPSPAADFSLLLQTCWTLLVRSLRFSSHGKLSPADSFKSPPSSEPNFFKETLTDAHSAQPGAD